MGDPGREIDLTGFEIGDNALEVRAGSVAAAEQRQLAAVEIGIVKGHIALKEANEDQSSAMRDIVESVLHRLTIASRIKYSRWQIVPQPIAQSGQRIIASIKTRDL